MRKIYNFLSSIRLAVAIFFLLAAGSIAGTFVDQKINDVYHSWWFSGLLVLLAVNLAVCLSKRLPSIWRAYSTVDCDFTHNLILNFRHHTSLQFEGTVYEANRQVEASLRKRKYKFWFENYHDKISMFATKGAIGRLGPVISHVSIFLILTGAALSSATGYRSLLPVYKGMPVNVPHGNFSVVLDKFWVDYYENGRIKDYFSTLSIIDNGITVLTRTVQVNEPMQYKGIWFYQSNYGKTEYHSDGEFIQITGRENGNVFNDAALLQIAKDPGVNIVWVGSGLLMAGLFTSFFIFHRRLWVRIEPSENSSVIFIGGLSNKDIAGFEREMDNLICDILRHQRTRGG